MSDDSLSPPSNKFSLEERERAVKQWFPLVRKLASRYIPRLELFYEYKDLVAIGKLALWQASLTYENDHGATFGTYGFYAVRHAYEALLKHWFTKSRRAARRADSLDELGPDDLPKRQIRSTDASAEELLSAISEQEILRDALLELSPRERRIIQGRFLEELCLEDLAEEFDLSRERIRQIEIEVLGKLRKKLNSELAERPKTARPVSYAQSTGRGQRNSRQVPPGKVASPQGLP